MTSPDRRERQRNASVIDVIGADANNLKNVDVIFPLKRISVVTGVSGSGKSSLLVDTLAAEGGRRMRTFLGTSQLELERDDVRAFIGRVPPTILVGQRGFRPSVRTTVGTATGFLSILRRLFVIAAAPYSERAKADVPRPSPTTYASWIARYYRGQIEIWAAPVRLQRTDGIAAVKRLARHGLEDIIIRSEAAPTRLRESGRAVKAAGFKGLNRNVTHTIEALAGTFDVRAGSSSAQIEKCLERAFLGGGGSVVVTLPSAVDPDLAGPFGPRLDSTKHWVHPKAPEVFARPSIHLLTFNAPLHADSGACRGCNGTGRALRLVEAALVTHPERSMHGGALAIWTAKNYKHVHIQHETIEGLRGMSGFDPDIPWSKLPTSARELVLNGGGDALVFDRDRSGRKFGAARPFAGFRTIIVDKVSSGAAVADRLADYVEAGPCDVCGGTRWSGQARALRIGGHGVAEILAMTFSQVETFLGVRGRFARAVPPETSPLLEALRRHAHSIVSVGLSYLTGERGMLEVSEGESRRIRLARVLDLRERGLCLLLDEPARGLHESDLSKLAFAIARLRGEHTVILNEHRERLWDVADWHVEVGPGAGAAGGRITHAGSKRVRVGCADELLRAPLPVHSDHKNLSIKGASIHNVANADCQIPLGRLTCISGVSGSGKSSFVRGVLAPALLASVGGAASDFALRSGRWRSVKGAGSIGEIVALDQAMPTPNRRSLVATLTDVFDGIRRVFGASLSARADGLSASDFGVNAGSGRCPSCQGVGEVEEDDMWSVCPLCGGSRYGHAALSVRIGGTNIQELLETPVNCLADRGDVFRIPRRLIEAMCDLGIGYVALGRRVDTLSGGEVQRLRLAMRLAFSTTGSMFFILDEPAVGLHPQDVRRLAVALERVLDGGRNTVVMVEHDLRLIRCADWAIEFGPGSGPAGGRIVFAGTPALLARSNTPTGLALAGRIPTARGSVQPWKSAAGRRKLPAEEQEARTTALLRTLISGDAPAALESTEGSAEPTVVVSERLWLGRDSWEVGGLDCEIPRLLLDVQRPARGDGFADILAAWHQEPDAWLAIQPFLAELQVWGEELPESIIRRVSAHLSKEGLRLVTTQGAPAWKGLDSRKVRATGSRFVPRDGSDSERRRVLRDAFATGARYTELRDRRGRLLATASERLLDLDRAIIAPMAPVPSHFSRLDPRGRCPMCKGSRGVARVADSFVIGNPDAAPEDEGFLTAEADSVLRGIRRSSLIPFLRRMGREGLWDPQVPFDRLDREGRNLILFGYWARPGAGTFLKSPKSNPTEVGSWLRWDGLYAHVLAQAGRSRNTEWASRVVESARVVRCLLCEGSGLHTFASLLRVGDLSFSDWTRLSDHVYRFDLLRKVEPNNSRQLRARDRVLHCLAPLLTTEPAAIAAVVVKRSVSTFTTIRTALPKARDLS